MGVYDLVRFKCKHCGTEWKEQTKADWDSAYLRSFTPETAPEPIKQEIYEVPPTCPTCQKPWYDVPDTPTLQELVRNAETTDHSKWLRAAIQLGVLE